MNKIWYVLAVNKRYRKETIFMVVAAEKEIDARELFEIYLIEQKLELTWFDVNLIDGEESNQSGVLLVDRRTIDKGN